MSQTNNLPFVSVILPTRNEQKHLSKCLDSLVANDYPKEKMELLVVDGMSQDRTREILNSYKVHFPFFQILDNPCKVTPFAWNIGIKNSKGEILVLIGAHASYSPNYISKLVDYLIKYKADNVGGVRKSLPGDKGIIAKAIALSLQSFFGQGDSYFKIGVKEPKLVDTVLGGCYRREVFDKIGLFNEKLVRSQDLEFNIRLKKAGGKILLVPDVVTYYYARSDLKAVFLHNIDDGIWITYPLKFIKILFRPRHYFPLFFVLSLLITGILAFFYQIFRWVFSFIFLSYLLASLYFSLRIALKEKDICLFLAMPLVFASRHFGYGIGSIIGLFKLLF